ncbi:dTDP-4-dehydrorhamnose 3,5-epimerase [Lutibacter sp. A64]|uniref:dTDP-4-dehydrorhamnose 3,5-epimerase n=1 Tax=Lutibacter sp. A64 TaxID=2918526 RepID=UPI001F0554FB|nr:dTDP-4-dehydrorhamnose 3,5-epimerase [Lutibacter sp. A64]UMB53684.1 dTDP-4-dehydrorhamnose 3,5-epimerase [Lutibacter sp. A64]
MEFIRTNIPEVVLCKPTVFKDDRGYFYEVFKKESFEKFIGYSVDFCQDNEAKSSKGVLRGLHYQLPPFAQSKLVRVIKGKVLDVVVDIRKNSKTFGEKVIVELSEENKHQLFVPKGFAHGYLTLSDDTIFCYKVDAYYNKKAERGILYNDQELAIDWGFSEDKLIISEKDKVQVPFNKADLFEPTFKMYE